MTQSFYQHYESVNFSWFLPCSLSAEQRRKSQQSFFLCASASFRLSTWDKHCGDHEAAARSWWQTGSTFRRGAHDAGQDYEHCQHVTGQRNLKSCGLNIMEGSRTRHWSNQDSCLWENFSEDCSNCQCRSADPANPLSEFKRCSSAPGNVFLSLWHFDSEQHWKTEREPRENCDRNLPISHLLFLLFSWKN